MFLDPTVGGPSMVLQTTVPSSDVPEPPLFEPDTSSLIPEDQPTSEQGYPSPLPPLFAGDRAIAEQSSPSPPFLLSSFQVDNEESQAMEEMRGQFQWLVELLAQNNQKWSSAYRDFANVLLLLHAVEGLGIFRKGNGKPPMEYSVLAWGTMPSTFQLSLMSWASNTHRLPGETS